MKTPREIAELHISASSLGDAVNAYCVEAGVDKSTVYYPAMAAAIRAYAATLLAKQAEDARDAARYRWLRMEATRVGHGVTVNVTFNIGHDWVQHYDFDAFDVAIDAAKQEKTHV